MTSRTTTASALKQASSAIRSCLFAEAEAALRPLVVGTLPDPLVRFYLGRVLRLQKRWADTVSMLEPLITLPQLRHAVLVELAATYLRADNAWWPNSTSSGLEAQFGDLQNRLGKPVRNHHGSAFDNLRAAQQLLEYSLEVGDSIVARFLRGWIAERQGKWADCRRYWLDLRSLCPAHLGLTTNIRISGLREAESLLSLKKPDAALTLLSDSLPTSDAQQSMRYAHAKLLLRAAGMYLAAPADNESWSSAVQAIRRCSMLAPDDVTCAYYAALLDPGHPMPTNLGKAVTASQQGMLSRLPGLREFNRSRLDIRQSGHSAYSSRFVPFLPLFTGNRDPLRSHLLQRLRTWEDSPWILHSLALCSYWEAKSLPSDASLELTRNAWESAMAAWVAVVEDERFWTSYFAERKKAYDSELTEEVKDEVRVRIGNLLQGDVEAKRVSALESGQEARARLFESLELLCAVERRATRAIKEARRHETTRPSWGDLNPGPLLARWLGLSCAVGRWIDSLRGRHARPTATVETSHTVLQGASGETSGREVGSPPEDPVLTLVRCYSQLGVVVELLDRKQSTRAIEVLNALCLPENQTAALAAVTHKKSANEFAAANPVHATAPDGVRQFRLDAMELKAQAHLSVAVECLGGQEVERDDLLAHWRAAIDTARQAGIEERVREEIVRSAMGGGERRYKLHNLDQAVAVLEAGFETVQDPALGGKLADLLTDRGVDHANNGRFDRSTADLWRANQLAPLIPRTVTTLATVLRIQGSVHVQEGRRLDGVKEIEESIAVLQQAAEGMSEDPDLSGLLVQSKTTLAEAQTPSSFEPWFAAGQSNILKPSAATLEKAKIASRRAEALGCATRKEFESALDGLNVLLRECAADDAETLEALRRTYLEYARSSLATGNLDKALRVLGRATKQFPNDRQIGDAITAARAKRWWTNSISSLHGGG